MRVEPPSGCRSNNVLGQPQRDGQSEARRHAEPVDTRSLQVKKVRREEGGYERDPADLMTKPLPRPKIEQLMNLMHEFMKTVGDALKSRSTRT